MGLSQYHRPSHRQQKWRIGSSRRWGIGQLGHSRCLPPIGPMPQTTISVLVPCGDGLPSITATVKCSDAHEPQHTVTWDEPIELPVRVNGKAALLEPGFCNLYRYPKVYFGSLRKGVGKVPPIEALYVLEKMLLALLLDMHGADALDSKGDPLDYAHRLDAVGARPQHGLLVANTSASVNLVLLAFRERPALIPLRHGPGPFAGENALHILAVNSRDDQGWLCELIDIATSSLDREDLKLTFHANAVGEIQGQLGLGLGLARIGVRVGVSPQVHLPCHRRR